MRMPSADVRECADATRRLTAQVADALTKLENATDDALIALTRWGSTAPDHRDR